MKASAPWEGNIVPSCMSCPDPLQLPALIPISRCRSSTQDPLSPGGVSGVTKPCSTPEPPAPLLRACLKLCKGLWSRCSFSRRGFGGTGGTAVVLAPASPRKAQLEAGNLGSAHLPR